MTDTEQFVNTLLNAAKQEEANIYILQGRAQAFKDVAKLVQDTKITITYPKPDKKEGDK